MPPDKKPLPHTTKLVLSEIVLTSVNELPSETDVNTRDPEHETPTKSIDNPEIVLTSVDELPSETDVNKCIVELRSRGYIYKNGLINYAFSKKEPSLLKPYTDYLRKESKKEKEADNTDEKQNISTNEKQSISADEQQSIYTDENTSTNSQHLKIAENLYLNSWCIKNASSMIGYSSERKKRFKKNFKNRVNDLNWVLYKVCVGVLITDGFIQQNAAESYAFIDIETHFLTSYNEYLDNEAKKLTDDFDGLTKWCENEEKLSQLETFLSMSKTEIQEDCNL